MPDLLHFWKYFKSYSGLKNAVNKKLYFSNFSARLSISRSMKTAIGQIFWFWVERKSEDFYAQVNENQWFHFGCLLLVKEQII